MTQSRRLSKNKNINHNKLPFCKKRSLSANLSSLVTATPINTSVWPVDKEDTKSVVYDGYSSSSSGIMAHISKFCLKFGSLCPTISSPWH